MQTMINWLLPADQSPIETTIGYEQVAIEVTASIAQHEPDPYLAQIYRFGLLEDFDHLYRYSALLDRVEGKDANNILQSYTDIRPGRPTEVEHRAPVDDVRRHYDRKTAAPITRLNAITLFAGEYQTHDYYMHVGPLFADPIARMLYAEIASIEEQHVTQYESIVDPTETLLEKWLLHEAAEVYNFWGCAQSESNKRLKGIWERLVDYELGQLAFVRELFERVEKRDAFDRHSGTLPEPIDYSSQREFVRDVLAKEANLRAVGTEIVPLAAEKPGSPSVVYRDAPELRRLAVPDRGGELRMAAGRRAHGAGRGPGDGSLGARDEDPERDGNESHRHQDVAHRQPRLRRGRRGGRVDVASAANR